MSIKEYFKNPLFVKEHGSWVMIFLPFLAVIGKYRFFSIEVLLLLTAVLFFFFAYRPLEIYLTCRLKGQNSAQKSLALFWMVSYACFAVIPSAVLLFINGEGYLVIIASAAVVFFICGFAIAYKYKAFFIRDVFAIIGLSSITPAVYLLQNESLDIQFILLWLSIIFFFLSSAFYVHMKMFSLSKNNTLKEAQFKNRLTFNLIFQLSAIAGILLLIRNGFLTPLYGGGLLPIFVHSVIGSFIFPQKPSFKKIGMIFTLYAIIFFICISI